MLQKMFQKPTKWRVMKDLILKDTEDTVVNSLGIISFVSFFIGGVITIQLALSTTGSFYPDYLVGYATRETIILEFAPTIISIIMAGKVGSFITSSIGSMRVKYIPCKSVFINSNTCWFISFEWPHVLQSHLNSNYLEISPPLP